MSAVAGSSEEVARFLEAALRMKYKAALSIAYRGRASARRSAAAGHATIIVLLPRSVACGQQPRSA
jgi:hypothetical protein